MNSVIPWVGGKGKLLWLLHHLAPPTYSRFVDVFGGSGTVILNRPLRKGCEEIYNDFNSNLTNLFCCVKERPMALLREIGFLPLHSRDDFQVLHRFFTKEEITDDYLEEELKLTDILLPPLEAGEIRRLMLERAHRGDLRRAADYFKLIRGSYSGTGTSFAGKPCNIRHFFHLIWECSRSLQDVAIENRDFGGVLRQYDREDTFFYCDPPYYGAECYAVEFSKQDHLRLHRLLTQCRGYVMVSYNFCPYICELYKEFYIFRVTRPNSMSLLEGSEYEEVVMTNYDPGAGVGLHRQMTMFDAGGTGENGQAYQLIHTPPVPLKKRREETR